jgi:polygalacturonase
VEVSSTGMGLFGGVVHQTLLYIHAWISKGISCLSHTIHPPRPAIFAPVSVSDLIIHNVTFQNSPMFNIHMTNVSKVHIYNITIFAPPSHDSHDPAQNTDGIDVGNSRDVLIENSHISVGMTSNN